MRKHTPPFTIMITDQQAERLLELLSVFPADQGMHEHVRHNLEMQRMDAGCERWRLRRLTEILTRYEASEDADLSDTLQALGDVVRAQR